MAASDIQKQAYLDALAECGVRSKACKQVGISWTTPDGWAKSDPQFEAAVAEALEQAADTLEEEAIRRGRDGVSQTRYTKDGTEYVETRYSDQLLMFVLKGVRGDKYADRQKTELTGANGGAVQLDDTSAAARLAALLDAARQRKNTDDIDPLS